MEITRNITSGLVEIFSNICISSETFNYTNVTNNETNAENIKEDIFEKRLRSDSVDSGFGDDDVHDVNDVDVSNDEEFTEICLEEVMLHDNLDDAWIVLFDKVYDVTDYLTKHPGGEEVIFEYLGYDATMAFRSVGHSKAAVKMLEKYLIGILPRSEWINFTN